MARLAIGFDESCRPRCRWMMVLVDKDECSWKRTGRTDSSRLNGPQVGSVHSVHVTRHPEDPTRHLHHTYDPNGFLTTRQGGFKLPA